MLKYPLFWYEFKDDDIIPFIEAGISPHFFVKGTLTNRTTGRTLNSDYEIEYLNGRRFRVATNVAFGFQFSLSPSYQLFVQSNFRLMRSLRSSGTSRITNMGLEFGVRRALYLVKDEWHI